MTTFETGGHSSHLKWLQSSSVYTVIHLLTRWSPSIDFEDIKGAHFKLLKRQNQSKEDIAVWLLVFPRVPTFTAGFSLPERQTQALCSTGRPSGMFQAWASSRSAEMPNQTPKLHTL